MNYSAVIIARNEQTHIASTIENVRQLANEVVVVDDFSMDATPDIAEGMGAVVLQRKLDDNWAQQRNFGLDSVSNEWTLTLDADERLDDPLVPEAPYTAYTQFIGVTQHNLYHAGQIALLKRALAATTAA